MIKDYKVNLVSKWVKYNDYEIVPVEYDYYIRPVKNSKYTIYDPFEVSNEILKDILNLGKYSVDIHIPFDDYKYQSIEYKCKNRELQQMVLDFVKKYGLIGDINDKSLNDYTDNEMIEYNERGLVKKISQKEYISRYFVFEDFSKYSEASKIFFYDKLIRAKSPWYQMGNGGMKGLAVAKGYTEKIFDILLFAEETYNFAHIIEQYLNEDDFGLKGMYEDIIISYKMQPVETRYFIDDSENIAIRYCWDSLKSAIRTMLRLNETSEKREIKLCKYCWKPFIAENLKAEYDTPQCRNKANVYKSRSKNKSDVEEN